MDLTETQKDQHQSTQSGIKAEKPILFSTPMVQAILAGRKNQTRRVFKNQVKDCTDTHKMFIEAGWKDQPMNLVLSDIFDGVFCDLCGNGVRLGDGGYENKPKYQPGDIMWVRESWWKRPELSKRDLIDGADTWPNYEYQACRLMSWDDEDLKIFGWKRKPSIHMPKEAARIWLECTGVRVERVQDISEEDAIAEGVLYYGDESKDYKNYLYDDIHGDDLGVQTAKQSFETLWISINGQESWDSNPWVFVYDFNVLSTTGKLN